MTKAPFSINPEGNPSVAKATARRRRTFTLVEVMIAFLIAGITVSAAMGLLKTSIWAANLFTHRAAAANTANSRIEQLRTIPYADLDVMEESETPVDEKGLMDADGDYVRTTVIGDEYFNTRTVTVTVGGWWKNDMPRVNVSVTSIVASDSIMH